VSSALKTFPSWFVVTCDEGHYHALIIQQIFLTVVVLPGAEPPAVFSGA
jgi:hypothetical protein